jgi:hypothetical protein
MAIKVVKYLRVEMPRLRNLAQKVVDSTTKAVVDSLMDSLPLVVTTTTKCCYCLLLAFSEAPARDSVEDPG